MGTWRGEESFWLSVPVWVCSAAGNVSVPSDLILLSSFRQLLRCHVHLLLQLTAVQGNGTGIVFILYFSSL